MGTQPGAATVENHREVPQTVKSGAAIQVSISTSGCLCAGNKSTVLKRRVHRMFTGVLFKVAKMWKQAAGHQ